MSTQQGYSASFLCEIPEDLTCAICRLVLRDPIQVIDCGHRFCSPCFNNMLEYSKDQLLCPIDRQPVERDRVFTDKGMTRTINNLNVKCKNNEQGCAWTGHLGDLDSHEAACHYKVVAPQTDQYDVLNDLCKQLVQRVQRCEEKSDMKEKELAHLRFTIKEMKENFNRDDELKTLKEEVTYLKLTVKDMRDEAYKSKEQIITLKDSASELENKVEKLRKEKEEITQKCTNELKKVQGKNDCLEKQMQYKIDSSDKDFKNSTETRNIEINEQFSLNSEKFKNIERSQGKVIGDIKNLNTQLDNIKKEVESTKSHLDKSLNKSKNEMTENITEMKNFQDHVKSEVQDLQNHVKCVENVLFLFDSAEKNEVELKWIMENFKEKRTIGLAVYSPVFYMQDAGFEIKIYFSGKHRENVGASLKLHRGKSGNGVKLALQPFLHEYTLEVLNSYGGSTKRKVTFSHIQNNMESCFTIPPGLDKAKLGLGFGDMIKLPFDDIFVINDAIYIKCTLHL